MSYRELDARKDLPSREPRLAGEMDVGGREEGVNPAIRRRRDRACTFVDVRLGRAGEAADHGPVGRADVGGDGRDGIRLALRRRRKACFDDVDSHRGELSGDRQLFPRAHRAAGCLLAVTKGGVEDMNVRGHWGAGGTHADSSKTGESAKTPS